MNVAYFFGLPLTFLQISGTMTSGNVLTAHAGGGCAAKREKAKRKKSKRRRAKREKPSTSTMKEEPKPPLRAYAIFANERRPAVVAAMGEKVDMANVDMQIATLWFVETDTAKYRTLEDRDRERYADEKAAFDWGGGAASKAARKKTATSRKARAASFDGDAAQAPLAHDIPPPRRVPVSTAAASVYSYAVAYLQPFLVRVNGTSVDPQISRHQRTRWAAVQLMAAGCGSLRAPICNHTLRVASGETAAGQALLRGALWRFGLGELQELRELRTVQGSAGSCDFIQCMLEQEAVGSRSDGTLRDAPVARALGSLRVIKGTNLSLRAALIQQCAATLTELDCNSLNGDAHGVLPRCARLESLTLSGWDCCPPAAWLGLSQLHTLRGVNLSVVPAAAIAAALPQLRTLHLCHYEGSVEFPLTAFYDELLPRLRSFGLEGSWPKTRDSMPIGDVRRLPLLEDLKWYSRLRDWEANVPRQLMCARPSTVIISDAVLAEWLQAADGAGVDSPTVTPPLARVRALALTFGRTPPNAAVVARLLRAAPQLRQLSLHLHFRENMRWALSDAFTPACAFAGIVHPMLRHIVVTMSSLDVIVPAGCGVQLRQRHFPGLRRLTVDEEEYPAWVPRRVGHRELF
jgi:hypothetical protein